MVLTKVAHNDAKSLKKIGCIFPHRLGGWGGLTLVWKIPQNFYFSYFVSFPKLTVYKVKPEDGISNFMQKQNSVIDWFEET